VNLDVGMQEIAVALAQLVRRDARFHLVAVADELLLADGRVGYAGNDPPIGIERRFGVNLGP
jgi:hypothetical protein